MEFFDTDDDLFSEIVTGSGREVCDSDFGFKCE